MKGYHCLERNSSKVYTSRHVLLKETILPFAISTSGVNGSPSSPVLGLHPGSILNNKSILFDGITYLHHHL